MLQFLCLTFAAIGFVSADVAVIIGGEIDSAHGFKTVGTVSTVSNKCGLFNSSLPDMPSGKKSSIGSISRQQDICLRRLSSTS